MSAAVPLGLGNVPAPLSPGTRDPGGGVLFAWNGQPYWLDSQGNLQALTTAGLAAAWSQAAFDASGAAATATAYYQRVFAA